MPLHRTTARMVLLAGLALAGVGALGEPAHAAEPVVDAGALRAEVQADPWRLRFVDSAGREVLAEAPGTGVGPGGTLGFARRASGATPRGCSPAAARARGTRGR